MESETDINNTNNVQNDDDDEKTYILKQRLEIKYTMEEQIDLHIAHMVHSCQHLSLHGRHFNIDGITSEREIKNRVYNRMPCSLPIETYSADLEEKLETWRNRQREIRLLKQQKIYLNKQIDQLLQKIEIREQ